MLKKLLSRLDKKTQLSFGTWNYDAYQRQKILFLWVFIAILVCLNIFLALGWKNTQSQVTFYVRPSLLQTGGVIKPDDVPKEAVFSFAYQLFVGLNSFPESLKKNYPDNFKSYQGYFGASYREFVRADIKSRLNSIFNGSSQSFTLIGNPFDPVSINKNVKQIGTNQWLVTLTIRERVNTDSTVVSDEEFRYVIEVGGIAQSFKFNPFGLEILGVIQKTSLHNYLEV